jgi:hypothetical protein
MRLEPPEAFPENEEASEEEDDTELPMEQAPDAQQLRDSKIAHDNSGHPTNCDFARLLRKWNAKAKVATWVRRHFGCEACQAHAVPKARRLAAIPRSCRLNHVVGLDLVHAKNLSGDKVYWMNCMCWQRSCKFVGPVEG